MRRTATDALLALVQSFFADHLRRVRGASEHTVRAYRDALRMFFVFLADRLGRSVAALRLDDVRADAVPAFLHYIEAKRGNGAVTAIAGSLRSAASPSTFYVTTSRAPSSTAGSWPFPRSAPPAASSPTSSPRTCVR